MSTGRKSFWRPWTRYSPWLLACTLITVMEVSPGTAADRSDLVDGAVHAPGPQVGTARGRPTSNDRARGADRNEPPGVAGKNARAPTIEAPSGSPQRATKSGPNSATLPAHRQPDRAGPGSGSIDVRNLLVRVCWATAAVLVLGIAALLALPRFLTRMARPGAVGELTVRETITVGPRCYLHLVQVGRHRLVVGRDSTGMKDLVLLPPAFGDEMAEYEKTAERQGVDAALEHVEPQVRSLEDSGWNPPPLIN